MTTPTKPDNATNLNTVMEFVRKRPAPSTEAESVETTTLPLPAQPEAAAALIAAPLPAPAPEKEQAGRREQAAAPAGKVDYTQTFLQPVRAKKGKAVYIDEDTHAALINIAQTCGIPLSDLMINLSAHHFKTFSADIRAVLSEREKLNKKQLPY
ncbi:DUF3408 domain-containing protein [Hymenobacter tenuis]